MGVKGSWQRPGKGYEENHEAIFGKRERRQYVPPPLPGEQKDEKQKEGESDGAP